MGGLPTALHRVVIAMSRATGTRDQSPAASAHAESVRRTIMMDMRAELDKETVAKAYARWAPVYDLVFGPVFERGRRAAITAAERIGGRILEVGVGTGISLPDYSHANRIVGVDISEAMLGKARERVVEQRLDHVEALEVMDAEHLNFS